MWYLIWILVIRTGSDFYITPNERAAGSLANCQEQKIALEKEYYDNPVDWGDATSYSIWCTFKDE